MRSSKPVYEIASTTAYVFGIQVNTGLARDSADRRWSMQRLNGLDYFRCPVASLPPGVVSGETSLGLAIVRAKEAWRQLGEAAA
jgi:hypothetical protein